MKKRIEKHFSCMRKIVIVITTVAAVTVLGGCGNMDLFDTVYTYHKAIISLPDGKIVEGKVQNWTDYEDGDQIQVKIDGDTYLVHSSNIVLIAEGKER